MSVDSLSDTDLLELAAQVVDQAARLGIHIGTCESCTGGMVSTVLTSIPGASEVVAGAIVSYSNEVKQGVLGVSNATLAQYGAVSCECASEMCLGGIAALGCDLCVSITGIAGPGGGTPEKPVGTVCFGVALKDHDRSSVKVRADIQHFDKTLARDEIRKMSTRYALSLLRQTLDDRC